MDEIIVKQTEVQKYPTIISEVVALPGIKGEKGDPFTYDDFTPEQIAELQRPATEAAEVSNAAAQRAEAAAESVQEAVEDAEQASQSAQQAATAAQEAVTNVNAVIGKAETAINNANTAAETANTAVESVNALEERVEQAEATRVQSETQRQTAETNRASSEQRREANETQRQKKFAQIESDATSLENSLNEAEAQRVSAENARVSAETQRETAEQNRETEFSEIKNEAETLISQTTEAKNAATEAATSATDAASAANTAAKSANDAAAAANQAAENVDGRVSALEEKASQVYENLAAIESSGETNPNKIYIDGETLIPYVYKGGKFVPFKGGTDAYTENGFYISPYYLEATDLRYIGFKDIANDTTCYILTAGRCLKFDLNTYEVFWDVKLEGYGASWHSAAEQLRIIDDIVYIVCAYWANNDNGVHLVKLNDTDGSFISKELIPIPVRYEYLTFRKKEVLITSDFIVGIDNINKNIIKCNLQDLSTEIISPCLGILGNRWITTPDGSVVYSIVWVSETNVIKVLDENLNIYTITLSSSNLSTIVSSQEDCLYNVDLKNKVINLFNMNQNRYVIRLTDDGDNNFSNTNVSVRMKYSSIIPNQCYANNISNPNYTCSNLLTSVDNMGFLAYLSNKSIVFKPNINNLMLDANLCSSDFGWKYEIEKINTNFI